MVVHVLVAATILFTRFKSPCDALSKTRLLRRVPETLVVQDGILRRIVNPPPAFQ
jgi:hypothetical protein